MKSTKKSREVEEADGIYIFDEKEEGDKKEKEQVQIMRVEEEKENER